MPYAFPRTLLLVGSITSLASWTAAAQAAPEAVRVLVSRRDLRVVFPKDTARAWGWPARKEESASPSYVWGIVVEGMDGPRILWARLDSHSDGARRFPSLERLIAAARAQRCLPGMFAQCTDSSMRAAVERGHVVLTLHDSAQIARLFGLRPPSVRVWQQRPGDGDSSPDTARVEYVAPAIPLPTAATRQDAERSRRRYEASISTVVRFLQGGDPFRPLWLEVGDSVAVSVGEMHCRHDSCVSGGYSAVHDSGWTILDSTIARLQPAQRDSSDAVEIFPGASERRYVKALRAGRTMLRVRGLSGPSDTAASSTPPARQVEREIIVAPPIARVEITPRPDSIRSRETFTVSVRVFDREGHDVSGLPWQLEVLDGESRSIRIGPEPQAIMFIAPGRRRIAARLGAHADTVSVTVVLPNAR